jgi:hypothetical protein
MRPSVYIKVAAALAVSASTIQSASAEDRWYGWQPMLTDAASVTFMLGSIKYVSRPAALLSLGVGGYVLGSPTVHAAHGNWGRAGVSLGLRVGLPTLGFVIAAKATSRRHGQFSDHEMSGGIVGAALGVIAAAVIDYAWLSKQTISAPAPRVLFSFGANF